jgi:hypothetical protein
MESAQVRSMISSWVRTEYAPAGRAEASRRSRRATVERKDVLSVRMIDVLVRMQTDS